MSATYAGVKGKTAATVAVATARPAAKPLTEAERARIARTKAFIEEHLPEAVDVVKDFYAAGLIDGWRSVTNARLIEGNGDGTQ